MAGLIFPTPGLIMGAPRPVELVSTEINQNWGRSGNDPAPYTLTKDPAADQVLVVGTAGRVGTREGSQTDTDAELDGDGEIFNTKDSDSQGKEDDTVGGSFAHIDGSATDVVLTMQSVDTGSRIDNYCFGAFILDNTSVSNRIDSEGICRDGSAYSVTVDVVAGGYVVAFAMIRAQTQAVIDASWTGVSALGVGGDAGDPDYSLAGAAIDSDGTLTVTLGAETRQGYMGVVSYGPL